MAFNVSYIYSIKDKFSGVAVKIKKNTDGIAKSFRDMQVKVERAGKKLSGFGRNLSLKVTAPLLAVGALALKSAADIETMKVAFESMTGSATKAGTIVKGLIDFAAKTPFQLIGIGAAAKQLLAAGVTTENLQSKLKFLGDIAAGANKPLSEIAGIFAKSKAKGKAMTEEILQLSDKGIPIISVLAKKLNVSKTAIFDLASKGKISFGILESAMISMSNKGGVFADQMKKQSGTIAGIFSTLKDNVNLALASLGEQLIKTFDLKNTITSLIGLIQRATAAFVNFTKENPRLAKLGIIMVALAAAAGPLLVMVGLAAAAFAALSVPALVISGVILAIGAGIASLIVFWSELKQAMQNILDFWSGGFLSGIKVVGSAIKDIISAAPDFLFGGGSPGVASQTNTNNSRLDGEITVNAPPGVVGGIESRQSGANIGNLGIGLAG
jgi:tape measure domain-containing protein